jgi:hypothetical protein
VNVAQDFSPGTANGLNDLVPEARLSPRSTDQFRRISSDFHTVFWRLTRTVEDWQLTRYGTLECGKGAR